MTAQAKKPTGSVPQTSKPPYTFRTAIFIFLLAINFVVAAMYFHIINP